jgi:K+-sensing histidine kinase KdpD
LRDNGKVTAAQSPGRPHEFPEHAAIGAAIGGLGPIVLAALLVGVRGEIDSANVALLLVLIVLAAGVVGGRLPGAIGAVSAALSFDFFHTQPYGSLTIASSDDVETTLLLLAVGLVAGQIAVRARRSKSLATQRRSEIQQLHRVAELVAAGTAAPAVEQAVCDELVSLLGLRACRFATEQTWPDLPQLQRNGALSTSVYRVGTGDGFTLPEEGVEIPVLVGGHARGWLVLEPDPDAGVSLDRRLVAVAIADQLGAALSSRSTQEDK